MLKQKIIYDKQCTSCKLIAGSLFMGGTAFHGWRISQIWRFYRTPEKVFNVFMIGVLASISLLNFNAAYEIQMGKNMKMDESRPEVQLRQGYKERLTEAIAFQRLTDDEKKQFIQKQIEAEEQKNEINNLARFQKKAVYSQKNH